MSRIFNKILLCLPYLSPFLFVDDIIEISDKHIIGEYTYKSDEYFYKGHFKNNPVTPGVILIETMGQIGLVCFAIYLSEYKFDNIPLLSYVNSEFFMSVKPNEKVFVRSDKIYFRNNTLKCKIEMKKEDGSQVANLEAILKLNQHG